ncbi:MAG TPA: hypothetical protein VGM98_10230, partial [Schlesneria sp.]
TGPVNVTLQNLPGGVTAAAAMIPADQASVDIKLVATAEAAAANVTNLTAKADAMAGNAKVEATSAAATLTVE